MLSIRSQADVEYAVMLAVLNFHKEFMQSHYSSLQVRLLKNVIEVDLARASPIPAEKRLAQTEDGCAQLRQMHQALFAVGQDILKKHLEDILGDKIFEIVADLEPLSGRNTIVITLNEALEYSA